MTEINLDTPTVDIDIEENSRVFVCGKTGSGKTYLSESLLKPARRLIVFDPKNNLIERMDLTPIVRGNGSIYRETWRKFIRGQDIRVQVTAPIGIDDDFEFYNEWFKWAFFGGRCIVYIDELLSVSPSATDLPKWLKFIYTRGREPIKKKRGGREYIVGGNIGVVACTQRPAHIPVFCMTESEEFFIFQLQNPDDRKKVANYTTPEVAEPIQDEHGFYYYKTRSNQATYIPNL